MTPYSVIYDAFKSKILEDEWINWTKEKELMDLRAILEGAISRFKFPRKSLERNDQGFLSDLDQEVQILATYMKVEWINRSIATWENIKPLYDEADFSPGNRLDKLIKLSDRAEAEGAKLEAAYYRSVQGKPHNYSKMAGMDNG